MEGLLLIDKPAGWTSFDVVNYVRKMVAQLEGKKPLRVKVGHTGTLDPAATGLLILCVGKKYTSRVPELIKQDKTYEVELTLGATSTTGDKEGEIVTSSKFLVHSKKPSETDVKEVIGSFVGEIEQTPPAYSAVKVNGKRAYELAREGKKPVLKPRKVSVYGISDVRYNYPSVHFTAEVSSGTYIRSLAEDIGTKLGCGAYMSELRRIRVGEYSIDQALAVSALTEDTLQNALASNR